jgi:uncharacterized membrane protein YuzA (DUF378 family)
MTGGKSCGVCCIVGVLVALGAINWGLYGVFGVDLVARVLGEMTTGAKVVYGIIGVAGLMKVGWLLKCCPCQKGSCESK